MKAGLVSVGRLIQHDDAKWEHVVFAFMPFWYERLTTYAHFLLRPIPAILAFSVLRRCDLSLSVVPPCFVEI